MIGLGTVALEGWIETFWKRVECWLPWLMEKIWGFRLVKMVKIGFYSIYFTHLKLPFLKLIFHSHHSCNLQDV